MVAHGVVAAAPAMVAAPLPARGAALQSVAPVGGAGCHCVHAILPGTRRAFHLALKRADSLQAASGVVLLIRHVLWC